MALRASKVTRKGQVTIPIEVREKLNIQEGDTIFFEEREDHIAIVRPQDLVERTSGVLKEYAKNFEGELPSRDEIWIGIAKERGTIE
ncbi:MAG TPA: AbrB/MazE/SpoVT family DNA-binding domain-containing protein [Thermomicrobiales bacterium]|nr:AbrB/MazE/SpoVT family DNA-binding domain-containing protein [Thermomicrobiales bacterium]